MELIEKEAELERVRVNVWLSKKMYESLSSLGSMDNRSMSDLIREALRDYLEVHGLKQEDK